MIDGWTVTRLGSKQWHNPTEPDMLLWRVQAERDGQVIVVSAETEERALARLRESIRLERDVRESRLRDVSG